MLKVLLSWKKEKSPCYTLATRGFVKKIRPFNTSSYAAWACAWGNPYSFWINSLILGSVKIWPVHSSWSLKRACQETDIMLRKHGYYLV